MKAYNEQWIYNRAIVGQAERWHRQRLLTDEQITAVRKAYPVEFRQTNGFIEIGLFLFTTVAILGSYLLLTTISSSFLDERTSYGVFNVIFGGVVGIAGYLLISQRLLYRNGVDNAFVVTLTGFLAFGLNQFLPTGLSVAAHCLCTLPLLLLIVWYYGDTLVAFLTLATFYAFVFDGMLTFSWGKDVLPFTMMGVSIVLYLLARQPIASIKQQLYYADPINLTQWISLSVLAASGNYFVVRELNRLLLKPIPPIAPEIQLPWLFWVLTFGIPVVYLWQGFTKKNRMLIILGELGVMAAFSTEHYYVTLLQLNVALTLGGLALIILAVLGIRYLREARNGFTDAPDDESPDEFFINAETLTAIQATAGTQHGPRNDVRFGGGEFGGGGSEGKY